MVERAAGRRQGIRRPVLASGRMVRPRRTRRFVVPEGGQPRRAKAPTLLRDAPIGWVTCWSESWMPRRVRARGIGRSASAGFTSLRCSRLPSKGRGASPAFLLETRWRRCWRGQTLGVETEEGDQKANVALVGSKHGIHPRRCVRRRTGGIDARCTWFARNHSRCESPLNGDAQKK